mmetsp:Transcript_14582/g.38545  ORF Transcript_14582/g.38545 Transcript_14582/m.38545 type:complete len:202 (-) Transcript_14582:84-689(-)
MPASTFSGMATWFFLVYATRSSRLPRSMCSRITSTLQSSRKAPLKRTILSQFMAIISLTSSISMCRLASTIMLKHLTTYTVPSCLCTALLTTADAPLPRTSRMSRSFRWIWFSRFAMTAALASAPSSRIPPLPTAMPALWYVWLRSASLSALPTSPSMGGSASCILRPVFGFPSSAAMALGIEGVSTSNESPTLRSAGTEG